MPRPSEKQVYIRSRRPHHPALRCRGKIVYADQFESATKYECWTLDHLGNDMHHIYGEGYLYGWYLYASPDGEASFGPRTGNNNEQWKIEHTRKGYVSIICVLIRTFW